MTGHANPAMCVQIVMDWLGKLLGLPQQFLSRTAEGSLAAGGGVIQGTASEAALVCMLAARARAMEGRPASDMANLVVYTSDQVTPLHHFAYILGLSVLLGEETSHAKVLVFSESFYSDTHEEIGGCKGCKCSDRHPKSAQETSSAQHCPNQMREGCVVSCMMRCCQDTESAGPESKLHCCILQGIQTLVACSRCRAVINDNRPCRVLLWPALLAFPSPHWLIGRSMGLDTCVCADSGTQQCEESHHDSWCNTPAYLEDR